MWAVALAAILFLGCSAVDTKPIRIEMPAAKRHFIVMDAPPL